jgi:hypothetical protein
MQDKKRIYIFIAAFIVVIAIIFGIYSALKGGSSSTGTNSTTGYKGFNPFGIGGNTGTTDEQNTGEQSVQIPTTNPDGTPYVSHFHKITDFPIAGAAFFEDTRGTTKAQVAAIPTAGEVSVPTTTKEKVVATKTKAKTPIVAPTPQVTINPAVRYVDKVTGHIYEMLINTKAVGKISNSTIPSIYESYFNNTADSVIYRYLGSDNQTITSFMATLGSRSGEFLPNNITDISLSPDATRFFYLIKNSKGTTGVVRGFKDIKKTQIFTSPYTEWLSQWINDKKIYLTTKAASGVEGSMFSLNTNTGTLSKVFGGISGLTTLSSTTGEQVLYSISEVSGPHSYIFTVATHSTNDTTLYTLPEKCVWSKDNINIYCAVPTTIGGGVYPDDWYQGTVSFTDKFIKLNITTNEVKLLGDSSLETPLDGTHLFLDKDETQVFFTNKKDSTFWSVDAK